jgi:short-subunit dehydrogenase
VKIDGAIAVVTGASRGFGAATARLLAARGATVALVARTADALASIADEIRAAGGSARAYAVDLADAQATHDVAQQIARELGPVDILVNNAGSGAFRFLTETTSTEAVAMMAVPYFAALYMTRAALPSMLERDRGHIVNVTSAVALRAIPGATAYGAACWAMRGFTEALRADLYGTRIGVTLFASGRATTPGYEHYPGVVERMPRITRVVPLVTAERVADAIVAAVERERRLVVVPRTMRLVAALDRVAPWLVERLVVRTGWTHRRASRERSKVPP